MPRRSSPPDSDVSSRTNLARRAASEGLAALDQRLLALTQLVGELVAALREARAEPPRQDASPAPSPPVTYLPGLDSVGHGIMVRPNQPYELKQILFKRDQFRLLAFRDAEQVYSVPAGYDVDDSPPMPANQLLNQVMIEESFDRFSKQLSLDTSVAAGVGAFSISATASQTSQMRTSEEAYYAVRSSFIPLWSTYLADVSIAVEEINAFDVPAPFRHEHRAAYDRFFDHFGSHYVKRAWIGGKAQLFLTIFRSSGISKEEIHAGLKASYGASVSANAQMSESREKLQRSSQCSVAGKGGDELKLAMLSSLDETRYNEWLATVRQNPQTVELEVVGIWTLLRDPAKARALCEAYQEATTFTPISAAFAIDKLVFFIRGRKYLSYHIETQDTTKPRLLTDRWPALGAIGFDRIDAAFSGRDLISAEGEPLARKVFFFDKDQVVRIDVDSGAIDPGYPQLIREAFPGVTFESIDATLEVGRDTVYFFCGNRYCRFSLKENRVLDGYPEAIAKRWIGVTFDRVDAALYWGNGKVYFFKEDQHIRYDMVTRRADPGYPKQIVGDYVEDWRFFD